MSLCRRFGITLCRIAFLVVSVSIAMSDDVDAWLYAFGEPWISENRRDNCFGFRPTNGIHNVHMNQGNDIRFIADDGVWQDGALMIHFRSENRWIAVFLAYQSQSWQTSHRTGRRIMPRPKRHRRKRARARFERLRPGFCLFPIQTF